MADIGDILGGLLGAGANYAAYEKVLGLLEELGVDSTEGMRKIGQAAQSDTAFRPYTVTSNTGARFTTTPQGGLRYEMSEADRKRQRSLFGQASDLYGMVGQGLSESDRRLQQRRLDESKSMFKKALIDPSQAAGDYYENIRAAQRPEEARQKMALNQSLFSRGRGGISTAEFGGTAEEFGYEKARAEAGLQASAMARQQALGEQQQMFSRGQALAQQAYLPEQQQMAREQQALAQANALMGAGYQPQQQALSLFGASQIPSQLAQKSQLSGAELAAQANIAGLEGMLGMGKVGAETTTAFLQSLVQALTAKDGLFDF
jgi:hypothetical protein